MRTKIFFTTLLLFVGLISNAQDDNNSSEPKTKEEVRARRAAAKKTLQGETDENDIYKGNTKLINVTPDIYYLQGDEENMGIFLGKEGVLLIDTQNEEETTRNIKTIKRLSKKKPIDYLVNTSSQVKYFKSYSDLKKEGAILISGLSNLGEDNDKSKNSTSRISDITYSNEIAFNYTKEKVKLIPVSNSGNSIVYFTQGNVLFSGDLFLGRKYPLIDTKNGKSIKNINEVLSKIISTVDNQTKIIPGKGDVTNLIDVKNTKTMLGSMYKRVYSQRLNGKTLEQVLAMNLANNYDSQGYGNGKTTTEMFITSLYNEIAKETGPLDTRTPEQKANDRLKEMQKEKGKKN